MEKKTHKMITLIFALGYALSGLILFADLFLTTIAGKVMRWEETNQIISMVELLSVIISFIIIVRFFIVYCFEQAIIERGKRNAGRMQS